MTTQSCAGMSTLEAGSYEGHNTQGISPDQTDQKDNESPIILRSRHLVGQRPDRVLRMSMATSQRHAGSSSKEFPIVIHEEIRLDNQSLFPTGRVTVIMQTSIQRIVCAASRWVQAHRSKPRLYLTRVQMPHMSIGK